jgi:hypothetical protein
MKFYDCKTAPSPRRVRIFIAEKEIDIPTIQVDLRNEEQLTDSFKKINPRRYAGDLPLPGIEVSGTEPDGARRPRAGAGDELA